MTDQNSADSSVVAVPRSERQLSTDYLAPRTDRERTLVRLWSRRLLVEPIGVHDDFFELGGHSLAAAELLVDIAEATGIEVTARTLFLEPSIAELAAAIDGTEAD